MNTLRYYPLLIIVYEESTQNYIISCLNYFYVFHYISILKSGMQAYWSLENCPNSFEHLQKIPSDLKKIQENIDTPPTFDPFFSFLKMKDEKRPENSLEG